MSGKLHRYLRDTFGEESLIYLTTNCHSSLIRDDARPHSKESLSPHFKKSSIEGKTTPSSRRRSISLQSLPSINHQSPISRWESCTTKSDKASPSPPARQNSSDGDEITLNRGAMQNRPPRRRRSSSQLTSAQPSDSAPKRTTIGGLPCISLCEEDSFATDE